MIYRVRTRSGKDYLTNAPEPYEAINSKAGWTTVTFVTLAIGTLISNRTVILRGDALESVEIVPEEDVSHR